jgi:hypothetical protein
MEARWSLSRRWPASCSHTCCADLDRASLPATPKGGSHDVRNIGSGSAHKQERGWRGTYHVRAHGRRDGRDPGRFSAHSIRRAVDGRRRRHASGSVVGFHRVALDADAARNSRHLVLTSVTPRRRVSPTRLAGGSGPLATPTRSGHTRPYPARCGTARDRPAVSARPPRAL